MLYINEFELETVFRIGSEYLPDGMLFVDRENPESVLQFIGVVYSLTHDFGDALYESYSNPNNVFNDVQGNMIENSLRDIDIDLTYLELLHNKVVTFVNTGK